MLTYVLIYQQIALSYVSATQIYEDAVLVHEPKPLFGADDIVKSTQGVQYRPPVISPVEKALKHPIPSPVNHAVYNGDWMFQVERGKLRILQKETASFVRRQFF